MPDSEDDGLSDQEKLLKAAGVFGTSSRGAAISSDRDAVLWIIIVNAFGAVII